MMAACDDSGAGHLRAVSFLSQLLTSRPSREKGWHHNKAGLRGNRNFVEYFELGVRGGWDKIWHGRQG